MSYVFLEYAFDRLFYLFQIYTCVYNECCLDQLKE